MGQPIHAACDQDRQGKGAELSRDIALCGGIQGRWKLEVRWW